MQNILHVKFGAKVLWKWPQICIESEVRKIFSILAFLSSFVISAVSLFRLVGRSFVCVCVWVCGTPKWGNNESALQKIINSYQILWQPLSQHVLLLLSMMLMMMMWMCVRSYALPICRYADDASFNNVDDFSTSTRQRSGNGTSSNRSWSLCGGREWGLCVVAVYANQIVAAAASVFIQSTYIRTCFCSLR